MESHALSDDGVAEALKSRRTMSSIAAGGGGTVTNNSMRASLKSPVSRHVGADRTLIVHRVHEANLNISPVDQLLMHARTTVPAVLNYLYFGAANMAVVYFGKRVEGGTKMGIEGADDMKIRMLRFLTSEIWPQLLRTDVPDESQINNESDSPTAVNSEDRPAMHIDSPLTVTADNSSLSAPVTEVRQIQRQKWLEKSLDSGMQVLVYLKPGARGTKYLKLVLCNTLRRLHFDIADSREEKYRWDHRMLYIRMLDNLETQKAIDSYETYERYFRDACACAAKNCVELERPDQPLVGVVYHDVRMAATCSASPVATLGATRRSGVSPTSTRSPPALCPVDLVATPTSTTAHVDPIPTGSSMSTLPAITCSSNPSKTRQYRWFENLDKPESLTLDYKSYFMHPAMEVQVRAVKFMCGFLNGIGQGKLVIGVHEMERQNMSNNSFAAPHSSHGGSRTNTPSSSISIAPPTTVEKGSPYAEEPGGDLSSTSGDRGTNSIVTHNMMVDQLVVGVSITDAEIAQLQLDLSEQLQQCIPPIPPQAVQLDVVPVMLPMDVLPLGHVLLFFDTNATGWRDAFRQKANHAIRQLRRIGYSLCPFDISDRLHLKRQFPAADRLLPHNVCGWQLYAIVPTTTNSVIVAAPTSNASEAPTTAEPLTSPSPAAKGTSKPGSKPSHSSTEGTVPQDAAWCQMIHKMVDGSKGKGVHAVIPVSDLQLPDLRILEISVDLERCGPPLAGYRGKFFNGWPSIPIWNPMTDSITRVDRNYHIFDSKGLQGSKGIEQELVLSATSQWYRNASIVSTIFVYVCGMQYPRSSKSRLLRLVHPSFNIAFELKLGVPLVEMLQATPVGSPGFGVPRETICLLQTSLKVSRLSYLPLLLVHVYESLGSLLSPFPYICCPVSMLSLRVNPSLVPIYFYHDYDVMTLRPEVVLDTSDGLLKVVKWCGGSAQLETILGIGFANMSKRFIETRARALQVTKRLERTRSLRNVKSVLPQPLQQGTAGSTTSNGSSMDDVLYESSPSPSSMASPQRSANFLLDPAEFLSCRKYEPNIPLLRFSFLSGSHGSIYQGAPWTLVTLLKWLRTAAHDPHVRPFGHCDRSFGFYPDFTKEVCMAHIGDEDNPFEGEASLGTGEESPTSIYASSFDCTLCRVMLEWNDARSL